jgi:hypothetical protein
MPIKRWQNKGVRNRCLVPREAGDEIGTQTRVLAGLRSYRTKVSDTVLRSGGISDQSVMNTPACRGAVILGRECQQRFLTPFPT